MMPSYSEYRDSNISWMGVLPAHWGSLRTKTLFELMKRPPEDGDGVVTAFRDGEVTLRSNRRTDGFTNSLQEIGYQGIRRGDLVIHAMDAFAGAIGVSDSDGKSTPVYSVCKPREGLSDARYYARLVRHIALSGFIESLAKGIRERSTEFRWAEAGSVYLPVPPIAEQSAIAVFLDRETGKIDALIAEQEKLIALLAEKRQATISHAVTRGLNPDAPMKDSGVAWLGEVPAHWGICALSYLALIDTGSTPNRDEPRYWNGTIPWLKTGEINWAPIREAEEFITEAGLANSAVKIAGPGTLLMAMYGQGVTRGRVALLEMESTYNQACAAIRFGRRLVPEFGRYFFMAAYDHVRDAGNETSQMNLGAGLIAKIRLPVPPVEEQVEVVRRLDFETAKFDVLEAEAERATSLLKERRSALIAAAVTGQIDVRSAVSVESP